MSITKSMSFFPSSIGFNCIIRTFEKTGDISIIDPNGNTHEQGGELIPDVQRVLENTSDLRNDKNSRYLQLQPAEVKAMTGIDVKKPMSHAKALIEANKVYDGQRNKILNKISNRK